MNAFSSNAFSRPSAFTSAFGVAGDAFEGRILYFVGTAADEDWSTLGNWFNDRAGTSAAASIPEAGDRVYLLSPIGTGPAAPITLERVYVEGENVNLDGVTASRFTFSGAGADFFGSITGPVLVYWPVAVPLGGTVTGTISYIGYAQDPTGFVAAGADEIVNLTWDDPGIDAVVGLRYRVYRGLTSTFADATLLVEDVDALLYDDATVTNGTEYFYWLQVYYSNGASAFVGPESATPFGPPTVAPVLSVSADAFSFVADLSWTPSDQLDSPGFGYLLEYNQDDMGWVTIGNYGPEVTSANPDMSVSGPGSFLFRVTPYNDSGEGPSSNTAGIVLPGESSASYYRRPDGTSRYLRPDGVSFYLRP